MYLRYLDDERVAISRGLVRDTSYIHKFGAVPAMSTSTTGTVWDKNDTLYPWSAFANSSVLTANTTASNGSAATDDNGKTITIIGLDNNYESLEETITISAGTATTTNSFKRVFRAFTSADNINQFRVSTATGTEVLRVNIGLAQTLMAIYTVPAGYKAYILKGTASCQFNGDATGNLHVRYGGAGAFRVGHTFEVSGAGGEYTYDFPIPIELPEKTDIDVRCTMRSNNSRLTAAFDLILINQNGTGER
jgi:hypothetical protein